MVSEDSGKAKDAAKVYIDAFPRGIVPVAGNSSYLEAALTSGREAY